MNQEDKDILADPSQTWYSSFKVMRDDRDSWRRKAVFAACLASFAAAAALVIAVAG